MSDDPKPPGADGDYEVGYGRPPKASQFKPGRSGNPKGRPKGRPNARTIIDEALHEPVAIRIGGRIRKVAALEAILKGAVRRALQGSTRDLNVIIGLARATGSLGPGEEAESFSAADDDKVIAEFLTLLGVSPDLLPAADAPAQGQEVR